MNVVNELGDEHLAYWQGQCPDARRIVMNKPAELDNCEDCGAIATHTEDGLVIRVAWKPNEIDLAHLARGGTIWVSTWGGLPPHMLEVQEPTA